MRFGLGKYALGYREARSRFGYCGGRHALVASSVLAAVLLSGSAEAAPKGAPTGPSRSSSQFTLRREEAGGAAATDARARARAGDCAGALASFDTAVRVTVEPTLRRDRGLCHEKLEHPYPAIEDYRAYLTARPDAPDADQIRDRLARLEEQVGIGGPSKESSESTADRDSAASGSASGAASGEVSFGANGAHASASASSSASRGHDDDAPLGPKSGEQEHGYDYYRDQERTDEMADSSPLRRGEGFILGAFVHIPRYFFLENAPTSDLAYAVGATLRYSFGPHFTLISEVGYSGIGTVGEATAGGGPLLFAGGEWRIPFTKLASDQIVLGGGLDYERQTLSGTQFALNIVALRARAGYRHIFGPQFGIEVLADGGYGGAFLSNLPDSSNGSNTLGIGILGGSVALLVGF